MTVLLQASYRGSKERQLLRTFEKATLPGGFFVYRAKRLRFSLNDLKKIRLKSGFYGWMKFVLPSHILDLFELLLGFVSHARIPVTNKIGPAMYVT